MTRGRRGFHYALDPVRSLTEWELNDIVRELADLNAEVNAQQSEVKRLSAAFDSTRSQAMQQMQSRDALDIQAQRLAHAYMLELKRQLLTANGKLREKQQERDTVLEKLTQLRKYADNLDQDKDSECKKFDDKAARQGYVEADDNWLQRTHWKNRHDHH
jgi:chromosome segregation ATPase